MTYKEAKEILLNISADVEISEAVDIATEVLEKHIAKNPIFKLLYSDVVGASYCPNCKEVVSGYKKPNYCQNCGQALKWSKK